MQCDSTNLANCWRNVAEDGHALAWLGLEPRVDAQRLAIVKNVSD
eukprot:CAMPEP_0202110782 /NCGR_PEP_ID=MMETSP0965-20130614/27424_1 /ASSEMBLY_ACC=CAM_ASM_000507 /TAXON_ID=4773 /ORGANISM="Schizochytrium aggregatum, Strain ATCC28209" /LENGTH=44 /DNA_ID= /DNA_START= /DNA_END= /DNA_ORIENTATION=